MHNDLFDALMRDRQQSTANTRYRFSSGAVFDLICFFDRSFTDHQDPCGCYYQVGFGQKRRIRSDIVGYGVVDAFVP